ncbi:MAG: 2,3-cyclic phosphodiesterase [Pseudomonadota bacterium]|jgi:2'-5' RNA ligase
MIRAFLALDLPEAALTALRVQQFLLPLPRQVDPEQFHLTLVFLGEVPEPVLEAAHERFAALRMGRFSLRLQGLGLFGGARPRAAWAGVAPSEPLQRVQAKLHHAALAAGCPAESRRYHPHVTLGRFPPPPPEGAMRLERAVAMGGGFVTPDWEVREVVLFQSHLSAKGPRYDALARYPLG